MTTSVILGTAGHIDHGKTALVRALTGIDTDRLKEERQRGITIELGFAHLSVDDVRFGIVDVPGHERFIKAMVAGAGGIDLVMLVVAADEGVMPQTREHLDICQLLGVKRGLVALTKADLVDEEWLELVRDDLAQTLTGTFLEGAAVVPCSAVDGRGLDAIKAELSRLASLVDPRDPAGLLRLPLDRVFTIKGFGTVVTGTLLSGTVSVGQEVTVLPGGATGKVRGVQVHGEAVERAVAGQRTAVNLGGVDRDQLERGEVVVRPGSFAGSAMLDVQVELLRQNPKGIHLRTKVLFHLGTRQQEATCVLLRPRKLEPGQRATAQLRFAEPVVALPDDRFILRGFRKLENYGTTVGGGVVIRSLARKVKPKDTDAVDLIERMAGADPSRRVALEVLGQGHAGITLVDLHRRVALVPNTVDRLVNGLLQSRTVIRFDKESGAVVHRQPFEELATRAVAVTDRFHADNPLQAGINREELRSRLAHGVSPRLYHALVTTLVKRGELVVEQQICRRPNHKVQVAAASIRPLADKLVTMFSEADLGPPREAVAAETLGADLDTVKAAIQLLCDEGELVRVASLHFHHAAIERLQQRLVAFLEAEGQITPPQFKELVGQTRKFVIPLAEYFDARKVTLRIGDVRKLRAF